MAASRVPSDCQCPLQHAMLSRSCFKGSACIKAQGSLISSSCTCADPTADASQLMPADHSLLLPCWHVALSGGVCSACQQLVPSACSLGAVFDAALLEGLCSRTLRICLESLSCRPSCLLDI